MQTEYIILIIQLVLTFIGGLVTAVPVYYRMRSGRKAEEASAAETLTGSAMAFAKQCESRIAEQDEIIDDLKVKMEKMERHLRYWQRGATVLIRQLVDNGLEPLWDPNGGPDDEE